MTIINLKNVKKSFGDKKVLKNISFTINEKERIGLIGYNGSGKSTLANILFGELSKDEGEMIISTSQFTVGYLSQEGQFKSWDPILDESNEKYKLTSELGIRRAQTRTLEYKHDLSGGERLKWAIASAWELEPNLLILDEPTNYLDRRGTEWLIKELFQFPGAVIIISHNRYFLDASVSRILELDQGVLTDYQGNYAFYYKEKKRRREIQLQHYEAQQKEKKRIEAQMEGLSSWADKAHQQAGKQGTMSERRQMGLKQFQRAKAKKLDKQIKSKKKRLEKMLTERKIERPKEEHSVSFSFKDSRKRGSRLLEIKDLKKSFQDKLLFEKAYFYINQGEKIGIVGENGCGKSTLIKILMGEEKPTEGSIWISPSIKIAYLSQETSEHYSEYAKESLRFENASVKTHAMTVLASMGITQDMLKRPFVSLSYGEQLKIRLAFLMLEDYDVLILDEPTNHLDLPSREMLEEALANYHGTLIVISHDRYFMEKLCTTLLVFENNTIQRKEKNIQELYKEETNGSAEHEEDLLLIDTRISSLLGKLSFLTPGTEEYKAVDQELIALMKHKQSINK